MDLRIFTFEGKNSFRIEKIKKNSEKSKGSRYDKKTPDY